MEDATTFLGMVRRNKMDNQVLTLGGLIRRFMLGWIFGGCFLIVVSCVKYKDYIITTLTNNTWTWINAIMPIFIIIFGIGYVLKSAFR